MMTAIEQDWTALTDCPPWCALPSRHAYESNDAKGTQFRYHEPQPLESRAVNVAAQDARTAAGVVTVTPANFTLEWSPDREGTATEARQLAADLTTAANTIDQINGVQV